MLFNNNFRLFLILDAAPVHTLIGDLIFAKKRLSEEKL